MGSENDLRIFALHEFLMLNLPRVNERVGDVAPSLVAPVRVVDEGAVEGRWAIGSDRSRHVVRVEYKDSNLRTTERS